MTNEEKLKAAEEAEKRGDYHDAERLLQQIIESGPTVQERAYALWVLGSVATKRGNHTFAMERSEEALAISSSIGDRLGEARAIHLKGIVHANLSNYSKALECYHSVLTLYEELGDKAGTARVTGNIGNVQKSLSDYPTAMEYMARALSMYEALENRSGVALWTGNIGTLYRSLSDHTKALEYMNRALSLHEELGEKSAAARVTGYIGSVYANLADYPKALEYMSHALAMREELGDRSGVATDTGNIGAVYWNLSDYPKALEYMRRALSVHEELGEKSGVASGIYNIGVVFGSLADYSNALEYHSRALAMFEELGDRRGAANVMGNIGNTYVYLSDYAKALEYISRALAIQAELGNKSGVALWTGNIGSVYKSQGEHASALPFFEKALSLSQSIGELSMCAAWLSAMGGSYAAMKQYDKSREYLSQALELRRTDLATNNGVATLLLELGRVEIEEQNTEKAARLLEEARALAHELGEKAQEYQAHEGLAEVYELSGNFEQAYRHHKLFHSLSKEVQSEEARKKAEQIEQQHRVAEMERRQATERAAAEATTTLLHKVLPSQVAERLLNGERVADYFQIISILFIDIVGFTPIAARMPAKAVLGFLNYVFGEFDRVMKKHGVQKIKTIGDGYMAVSGAPVECSDHAERLARAALELMADIQLPDDIRKTLPKGSVFHLRMGLHTGSAFAGIVGDEGFVYDVYSDAVNLAARMESSGEPGKIHCSEEFAYHLQNRDESFVFEERGEIEVKGKGVMRTYFLSHV